MSSLKSSSPQLTAVQKARIEENRRQALERLKARNLNLIAQNVIKDKSEKNEPSKILPTKASSSSHRVNPYLKPPINRFPLASNSAIGHSTNQYQPQPTFSKTLSNTTVQNSKKAIKCTIEALDEFRFIIRTSAYDDKLIEEFKKIPSHRYLAATKDWSFLYLDYDRIIKLLDSLSHITAVKFPPFVAHCMLKNYETEDESCLNQIEPKLVESLMDFQRTGICFGIYKKGRCMIADDMGLGKTRQAIGIADFYRNNWPLLIITNATTRHFWATEIQSVLSRLTFNDIYIIQGSKEYFDHSKVIICSYNILQGNIDDLMRINFGVIIFDESHNLKNFKAKQTINAENLSKKAQRIIMLTGTPALSRPVELFPQLKILDSNFATYRQFTERYCNGMQTRFGWNANGCSNLQELNILLKKMFLIRRIKSDIFLELSGKNRELVILDKFECEKELDDDMEEFRNEYQDAINTKTYSEDILIKWYHSTSQVKASSACTFVRKYLNENDCKILLFAHHSYMMNALCAELEQTNIQYVRIDGSVRGDVRADRVNDFQTNVDIRVAVLSIRACNAGITLTSAKTVIFCEFDWNPSTIIQAEGRAHRIGQEDEVKVYFLLANNTVDNVIWELLQEKQKKLGKAGLVATVENFANNIKISTFNVKEEKLRLSNNHPFENKNNYKVDYFKDDDMDDEEMLKLIENLP